MKEFYNDRKERMFELTEEEYFELCKMADEGNLLLSILHDALREYYPKKEMSNYQKIIFAIDTLKNINK